MAFLVFDNPQDVTIGSVALTGVVTISTTTTKAEIHAAADADLTESVARYTTGRTSGTISFVDPVEAESANGLDGTLAFSWKDVKGATDKSVSISNASIVSWSATVSRDTAANATVNFISEAEPAVT